MTIPVENAPQYELGQRPPPPDAEEAREIAKRAGLEAELRAETQRGVRVIRVPRGCVFSALLLGGFAVVCGGALAVGVLGGGFDAARDQTLAKILGDLRNTAEAQGSFEQNRGELQQLDELRMQGRVDWLAFSVLMNRWTYVKTDHQITEDELAHVMTVVRDIDSRAGTIDPADYPDGR